jgi:type I restriction enzyme M protein
MTASQTRETLANEIWRACDILRRDNNCGGIMEYIEHLAWLLFLRFLDAQEEEWETQARLDGRIYEPILDEEYRWQRWAARDWPADDLLAFVHGRLIPYLQNLGNDPLRDTIRSVFAERNVIVCASGYNLKDVLQLINGIDFHSQDDIFTVSQVYEELLRRLGSENRMAGEFYTPRAVIRFIVELVNPQSGETVYDPACGTCGFLAQAYLWMRHAERTIEDHRALQEQTFYGAEKKPIPALLGLMNMVLHGVTAPRILRRNTLEENVRQISERYDVIMTNPPFGGIEGRHIQQNFTIQVQATELLFVQHIMKKLKPRDGARCGMVVPEGTLFRTGAFADVKRDLWSSSTCTRLSVCRRVPLRRTPTSKPHCCSSIAQAPPRRSGITSCRCRWESRSSVRAALSRTSTSLKRGRSGRPGMPIAGAMVPSRSPVSAPGSSRWMRLKPAAWTLRHEIRIDRRVNSSSLRWRL